MNIIDTLAEKIEAAKAREDAARAERIALEEDLLPLLTARNEGAITEHGDAYKVTVTYGVNRTLDAAALAAVKSELPAALFEQAIEYAPKLKLAGVRYLQNNEPQAYAVLAQALTAKPAKPSVRVERIDSAAKAA